MNLQLGNWNWYFSISNCLCQPRDRLYCCLDWICSKVISTSLRLKNYAFHRHFFIWNAFEIAYRKCKFQLSDESYPSFHLTDYPQWKTDPGKFGEILKSLQKFRVSLTFDNILNNWNISKFISVCHCFRKYKTFAKENVYIKRTLRIFTQEFCIHLNLTTNMVLYVKTNVHLLQHIFY